MVAGSTGRLALAGLPSTSSASTLEGLQPRTRYTLELRGDNQVVASGSVTTLPDRLPVPGEPPFTVMLGSCFYARADAPGTVGNVYFHVPAALQPDLKFLCGDQVYLDAPWQHFLLKTHSEAELRTEFLETYLRGWSQAGPSMGFSELLRHGATYFSSDDHDLWNNAPNTSVIARDTWTAAGRERWHRSASELYQTFQTPKLVDTFAVGSLSFLVLDTRMQRKADRSAFMPDESMQALEAWVNGCKGLVCSCADSRSSPSALASKGASPIGTCRTTRNTPTWFGSSRRASTAS